VRAGHLLPGVLCLSACVAALSPPTEVASIALKSAPPPNRVEAIPPAPSSNAFWMRGYWHWENDNYVWISGRWEVKRPGWHWVPAHWDMPEERWEFVAGQWQPN